MVGGDWTMTRTNNRFLNRETDFCDEVAMKGASTTRPTTESRPDNFIERCTCGHTVANHLNVFGGCANNRFTDERYCDCEKYNPQSPQNKSPEGVKGRNLKPRDTDLSVGNGNKTADTNDFLERIKYLKENDEKGRFYAINRLIGIKEALEAVLKVFKRDVEKSDAEVFFDTQNQIQKWLGELGR